MCNFSTDVQHNWTPQSPEHLKQSLTDSEETLLQKMKFD